MVGYFRSCCFCLLLVHVHTFPVSTVFQRYKAKTILFSVAEGRRDFLEKFILGSSFLAGSVVEAGSATLAELVPDGPPFSVGAVTFSTIAIVGGYLVPNSQYLGLQQYLQVGFPTVDIQTFESFISQSDQEDKSEKGNTSAVENKVAEIMQYLAPKTKRGGQGVVLIGHSKGCQLITFVAERLQSIQPGIVQGMVMIDPVDDPSKKVSCFESLKSVGQEQPVLIISMPFAGPMNRYYKTRPRNLCSPEGSDADAFYSILANEVATPNVLTCCLEEAGHLQILDDRNALPIANVCGVSLTETEYAIRRTISAITLRWVQALEAVKYYGVNVTASEQKDFISSCESVLEKSICVALPEEHSTAIDTKKGIADVSRHRNILAAKILLEHDRSWNYLLNRGKITWKLPSI